MAVPQTETLPTLYQYIGALTRPVTSQPKNRGRGGQIVGLVGQCTEWCLFSLWLGLFETVNPFPFVPICCIIKQKRLIVIGGSS